MTEQELNALVAELAVLDHDATPAPWQRSVIFGSIEGPDEVVVANDVYCGADHTADACLTVAARNALPALLSALQDARIKAAELQAAIARTRAYVSHPGNWSALDGRQGKILALLGGDQ